MRGRDYLRWVVSAFPLDVVTCPKIGVPAAHKGLLLVVTLSGLLALSACDSIQGYPQDPENSSAVIASLSSYFDPSWDEKYDLSADPNQRRSYRDVIVLSHMRAYDIEFDNFERGLYGQGNSIAVAGSLATITMGAVGGVAGAAVTKAALNSASSAVTGAEGAISKELYYQRTLPALITQMEANRTMVKASILKGIKQIDADYPLVQAYVDLESLKNAGGVPLAIANAAKDASDNKAQADDILSNITFKSSPTALSDVLENWIYPNGTLSTAHRDAILEWLRKGSGDPSLANYKWRQFLDDPTREVDRCRAAKALVNKNTKC
jgi:hypothetical protein